MNGTIYSTSGLRRFIGSLSALKWRWASLGVLLLAGALTIGWIYIRTGRQVAKLQQEFTGIQAESFYLGGQLRGGLDRMNAALLRFQLSNDQAELKAFSREVETIQNWLREDQVYLATPEERNHAQEAKKALERYRAETAHLTNNALRPLTPESAASVIKTIQLKSEPFLGICNQLVALQQQTLGVFLKESKENLDSLQWFLRFSIFLLLALILTLAALLYYRALIAPLRFQLSQSQATIDRQEKLASLGILATGVAHEIRNPLTAIKFRLFSLKKSLPAPASEHEDLGVIDNEINRLERIVKDFLQFARPSEPELVLFPARRLLQELHALFQPQLEKQRIDFKLECPDALWLRADKQQLEQVLINLIQNAADSIGQQGAITLRAKESLASLTRRNTPAVILEVIDTGKGIPADLHRRIFDPFFSTKEGGTGLGLPIAARIIEKHGGFIHFHSVPNRGATFSLVLPKPLPPNHESKNPAH